MSELSWTKKQEPTGKWFVITGTAYENVVRGKNATNEVKANTRVREEFYHDEAVRLSDEDLNKTNGVDGLPICVEHNTRDVVGKVHHSWHGSSANRVINIIARIDQTTPRGKQVVADLKAGKYTGFSIGYSTGLSTNGRTGKTTLESKEIREISLVEQPFFEKCQLAMGVEASSKQMISVTASRNSATTKTNYLSNDPNPESIGESGTFFVPIKMSNTDSTPAPATEPQATLPTTQAQRSGVPGEELLKQADSLKAQNDDATRRMQEMEARLKRFEAKEAAEQEAYAKAQEPKFQAYVTELEASRKEKLTDAQREGYRASFCDMRFKDAAKDLELQYNEKMELRASLKAAQDKATQESEKAKQLEQAVTKTTQVLNHSRADFAKAVDGGAASNEDEQRRKLKADVNASGSLKLHHIANPPPSIAELPFLKGNVIAFSNSVLS